MTTHTIRQATIFISGENGTSVYSSFDEIPLDQRRRLLESTTGPNSATIVIADRAGRAEIVRALRGQAGSAQSQLMSLRFPWTEAFARRAQEAAPSLPEDATEAAWPRPVPWTGIALWAVAVVLALWAYWRG